MSIENLNCIYEKNEHINPNQIMSPFNVYQPKLSLFLYFHWKGKSSICFGNIETNSEMGILKYFSSDFRKFPNEEESVGPYFNLSW